MKILVIEDDEVVRTALVQILSGQNYVVETAADGEAGWDLIDAFSYDLILLDVLLPKLDGLALCRKVRSAGIQVPILLLTSYSNSHDKATGLDAGADDYVVKPFEAEELFARVRALLRRGQINAQPILEWGKLQLNPSNCEVTYDARPVALTPKEYALLELFLRNHRRVFSCGMILEQLWSYEETPGEEAVRTHIKGLRQKLKTAGCAGDFIETVYGIGYRLKAKEQLMPQDKPRDPKRQPAEPQRSTAKTPPQPQSPTASIYEPTHQQTLALLNKVWYKFKERIAEQVDVLEQATAALARGALEPALRQQARQEAHTLVGALGTFGLKAGSELSRQIESKLRADYPLSAQDVEPLQQWVAALQREIRQAVQAEVKPESTADDRPLLLVVDRDYTVTEAITQTAADRGMRVEIAANLMRAKDKIFLDQPSVVLFDPAIADKTIESQILLSELKKHAPPIPVVIYTAHADLDDRLQALHLGGQTFLPKTVAVPQALDVVTQVLQQAARAKERILVVDDDPSILAALRALLEPWGFEVATLNDPQQFWQVLEASAPSLLILDVEMPFINGIELCQVVRNDSRWSELPILILTAHTDADTVNRVFAAGADDFVSKPVVGAELLTRTLNRLERIKLLKQRYARPAGS